MNHLGHMIVGLIVGIIAMLALNVFSLPLIGVILLGSLLPDVDLKQSKVSRIIEPIAILAITIILQKISSQFLSTIISLIISLLLAFVIVWLVLKPLRKKHRGITHSFNAAVVYAIAMALLVGIPAGIVGLLSYSSHLVVDRL